MLREGTIDRIGSLWRSVKATCLKGFPLQASKHCIACCISSENTNDRESMKTPREKRTKAFCDY